MGVRTRQILAVAALAMCVATVLSAQSPAGAESSAAGPVARLTAAHRGEIVKAAATTLAENYVDEQTGRIIGDLLKKQLQAGAYDSLDNPAQFAEAVTRDLQRTNGDLHLTLRFSPTPAPQGARRGFDPFAGARQRNFGLTRAEILSGNIGYLEFTGFLQANGWEEALVDALRFLSRTDAVIIDVRRNPGGSGNMGDLLASHFLGTTPVPMLTIKSRRTPEPMIVSSRAEVPGPRRPDVPLYILTSQGTGSAAEAFTFVLKNQRRATVVGTRTAGAGHSVGFAPAGYGFTLGFSITNVSDPATGLEWERVGVQPDVAVAAEQALVEAHLAALRTLRAAAKEPPQSQVLDRLIATVDASRRPQPADAGRMARFAGTYEGRAVTVTDGRVAFGRNAGAQKEELTHRGGTRFALGATQYLFEEKDGTVTLTVESADGTRVVLPRRDATAGK